MVTPDDWDQGLEIHRGATFNLAHNLGLRVVAEGAEDMAVWERLRLAGCDEVQGFVLAQPMPSTQALFVR